MRAYIGLYGNVPLQKHYCEDCQMFAFVLRGKFLCCDSRADRTPQTYKRESQPAQIRRLPPIEARREVLRLQNNACLYCLRDFGSHVQRGKRIITLRLHWDHFIPYNLTQNNYTYNFVAACHLCNGIKYDHVFQTVEEVRIYVATHQRRRMPVLSDRNSPHAPMEKVLLADVPMEAVREGQPQAQAAPS